MTFMTLEEAWLEAQNSPNFNSEADFFAALKSYRQADEEWFETMMARAFGEGDIPAEGTKPVMPQWSHPPHRDADTSTEQRVRLQRAATGRWIRRIESWLETHQEATARCDRE